MNILKSDIKNKTYKRIYLFYGEENYLKKHYEKQMNEKIVDEAMAMMNSDVFEGKNAAVENMINSVETLPFMSEYRLVIIKDTQLFESGRKDDTAKIVEAIENIPETTVLVFVEEKIDKRNSLYKKIASLKEAHIVEFKTPSEKELITWVNNLFKVRGKTIDTKTILYLLRISSADMETVLLETEKICAYKSSETVVTLEDINSICTKNLETKIFDLVDAIGNKIPETALDIFNNLILLKESPIMVLSMIGRQFRLIMESKILLERGNTSAQIAEVLGQRSFVISECIKQGKNFSMASIKDAVKQCLEIDIKIKTGQIDGKLAVETLILQFGSKQYQ